MPSTSSIPPVLIPPPFPTVKSFGVPSPELSRNKVPMVVWIAGGAVALMLLPCFACGLLGILANSSDRPDTRQQPVANQNVQPPKTASEPQVEPSIKRQQIDSEPKVTYANFNRVTNGMSRSEVCDILGEDYQLLSETEIGNFKSEMYSWKGRGLGNCNVIFQNDKVMSKAQFGLK